MYEQQAINNDVCWDGNNSIVDAQLMRKTTIFWAMDNGWKTQIWLAIIKLESYRIEAI
jgi:hypothetical protein